jgi:hypothetical protein
MRKRFWWETLDDRRAKMRKSKPCYESTKPKAKRQPYKWGAQQYLSGFEVGETRKYDNSFQWDSLKSIGSRLKRDYGVRFTFRCVGLDKLITRVL